MNGINHKVTAPYHPATNGQAERYVQTVKKSLRAMQTDGGSFNLKLCRFLIQYRKMPNATTGVSPAELMFKRNIRTRIDLVKRDLTSEIGEKQLPNEKSERRFEVDDQVQYRTYGDKARKWKYGTITNKTGDLHYEVINNGRTQRRHLDQLLPYEGTIPHEPNVVVPEVEEPILSPPSSTVPEEIPIKPETSDPPPVGKPSRPIPVRRSTRKPKPPNRMNL